MFAECYTVVDMNYMLGINGWKRAGNGVVYYRTLVLIQFSPFFFLEFYNAYYFVVVRNLMLGLTGRDSVGNGVV